MIKQHKYKTKAPADKKASQIKRKYGYRPTVFQATHRRTNKRFYLVVEPSNLIPINGKKRRR